MKKFVRRGEPFVWATGMTLSIIITMTVLLLYVVIANGIGVFWPQKLVQLSLNDGRVVLGEITKEEKDGNNVSRLQLKIGNREINGLDFTWISEPDIRSRSYPADLYVIERQENGNFYGTLAEVHSPEITVAEGQGTLVSALGKARHNLQPLLMTKQQISRKIGALNLALEKVNQKLAGYRYQHMDEKDKRIITLVDAETKLKTQFATLVDGGKQNTEELAAYYAIFKTADGKESTVRLADMVRLYQPNRMGLFAKIRHYADKLVELFIADPRESNTEGGLFPAIFGTVMLVLLMSLLSFPLGVITGIYLREYAHPGVTVKIVRIAVNNLAGIPSIVYGIFGLGFFIYGIGGALDQFFFPERLPTPTFGTGGILWASLTLGLLTVPVVIVATEEALGSIPPSIREGSLALGATRFQTLTRLLLPMASPGIMTGFILAMARAAGEVAPLMITGVVKLAPSLPIDGQFPYFHLNRKFMHLGFHIYDIGFQSPNVEAAKPMVYVTTLLLILIVLSMCSVAIYLRNKMRARYAIADV
ncbi:MAG: phosphate ABC transporter permease PstA [Desulfobulbaceae bacterium]|nr:phosphate ABC transporter permease PstA [Desulfobulbaceae bacterium]